MIRRSGKKHERLHYRAAAVAFNRGLDARPDVTVIILSLLCVILTVVSLYLQKQHRALESRLHHLESQNINDSTFVKHRLLGMQIDDLRKGDSRRVQLTTLGCYIANCCGPLSLVVLTKPRFFFINYKFWRLIFFFLKKIILSTFAGYFFVVFKLIRCESILSFSV